MGHEELVRHLIGGAEGRRDEILRQAREEADRRIAQALSEGEAMESASRRDFEREAARARDIRMSRARRAAKAMELRARASIAESILARLEDRLSRLPSDARYPAVAERLYREILPELPPGNVLLHTDANARKAIEPLAADPRIGFALLPKEELGGVEASDETGTIRIRDTLRTRFRNARPALMAEIRRRLAGDDE